MSLSRKSAAAPTPRTSGPAPQPNRVVAERATPDKCAGDYQAGTADRVASAKKDRRSGR